MHEEARPDCPSLAHVLVQPLTKGLDPLEMGTVSRLARRFSLDLFMFGGECLEFLQQLGVPPGEFA